MRWKATIVGVVCAFSAMLPALAGRPAAASDGRLAVIGDSLTVGMARSLAAELRRVGWSDARIDALVARRIPAEAGLHYSGVRTVSALRAKGFDPDSYIVALGTNDVRFIALLGQSPEALVSAMLAAIGPGRRVLWVDVVQPDMPVAATSFNHALDTAAAVHPEMIVYRWSSVAAAHPEWFAPDGTHLNNAGYRARATLVAEASRGLVEGGVPPEAYPPGPALPAPAPLVAPAGPLGVGSRGTAVRELQGTMRSLGWFFGPLTRSYGATTAAGVKRMQRALALSGLYTGRLAGRYDPTTQAALATYLADASPTVTLSGSASPA
jgi:lysophospholipase L1-like esterase